MAEHVQASLDRMVAPLRDLMDRQIFTEEEIRAVVSRRRESEYLLRRRAARKADFVRYIEAETLLEKLRVLRTARRKRDHRKARRETGLAGDGDADDNDDNNNNNNDKQQQGHKDISVELTRVPGPCRPSMDTITTTTVQKTVTRFEQRHRIKPEDSR